jgi:hypothetical protein
VNQWSSWKVPEAFVRNAINSTGHFNFKEFSNFCRPQGLILSGGSLSAASSRAWTLASTCRSWLSSHRSCGVNWFSKQSAIALALSAECYFRPKKPWMAVGAFGPSLLVRDFAIIQSQSQSHITTDIQSASPSWCQAPIQDPWPIFLSLRDFLSDSYCLLLHSALSDERTGL